MNRVRRRPIKGEATPRSQSRHAVRSHSGRTLRTKSSRALLLKTKRTCIVCRSGNAEGILPSRLCRGQPCPTSPWCCGRFRIQFRHRKWVHTHRGKLERGARFQPHLCCVPFVVAAQVCLVAYTRTGQQSRRSAASRQVIPQALVSGTRYVLRAHAACPPHRQVSANTHSSCPKN